MCPLQIEFAGEKQIIGAEGGSLTVAGKRIMYAGDGARGHTKICDKDFTNEEKKNLEAEGDTLLVFVLVHVVPIEVGEPTTPMNWPLIATRI